jgi:hypothetical protein
MQYQLHLTLLIEVGAFASISTVFVSTVSLCFCRSPFGQKGGDAICARKNLPLFAQRAIGKKQRV